MADILTVWKGEHGNESDYTLIIHDLMLCDNLLLSTYIWNVEKCCSSLGTADSTHSWYADDGIFISLLEVLMYTLSLAS